MQVQKPKQGYKIMKSFFGKYGEIPEDWKMVRLKDIVKKERKITYGIVQPGKFTPNGILLIRGQDYIGGWAKESDFFKVDKKLHQSYIRALTSTGDILLCIAGASVGVLTKFQNG